MSGRGRKHLHTGSPFRTSSTEGRGGWFVAVVVLVTLFAMLGAAILYATRAVAADVGTFDVVTLNVHGGTDSLGGGNGGEPAPVIADVVDVVQRYAPTMITLQELCRRQYLPLKDRLAALGYEGRLGVAHYTGGCNDPASDGAIGVAVFVRGNLNWWDSYALPWGESDGRGVQPRRLVCVTADGIKGRLCGTHLTPSDPDRAAQAARILRIVEVKEWKYVTLGGDLNMTADLVATSFPRWRAASGRIDHVLTMSNGTAQMLAVVPVENSDHPAVVARVTQGGTITEGSRRR